MNDIFSILLLESVSKSTASAWLLGGEIGLLVMSIPVVFGLWGENKTDKWSPHPPSVKRWHRVYVAMVIIGVAGELISDGDIFLFSHRLQTIQDGEIAAAKLELEKIKNPRVIKNILAVADKIRKYPNIKYWIVTETADQDPIAEQMKLSQQIRHVFDEAKWMQESHLNRYSKEPMPPFSAVSDPGCLVSTAGDEKSLRVMKAVIEAFKPDFECDEYVDFNIISDSVLIHVGFHGGK